MTRTQRLITTWTLIGFVIGALLTKHNSPDLARMATGLSIGAGCGYVLDLRLRIKNR